MKFQIVTFNTGRRYTDNGQRIACAMLPDGRVMFADVDRNIDGVTKWETRPLHAEEIQRFTMMAYDHGAINYGAFQPGADVATQYELDALMAELKRQALTL